MRVNIHTKFGETFRERYNFKSTPEFILFDSSGEEVWRAHQIPQEQDLALAINDKT